MRLSALTAGRSQACSSRVLALPALLWARLRLLHSICICIYCPCASSCEVHSQPGCAPHGLTGYSCLQRLWTQTLTTAVTALAWRADGKQLVAGCADGSLHTMDTELGEVALVNPLSKSRITGEPASGPASGPACLHVGTWGQLWASVDVSLLGPECQVPTSRVTCRWQSSWQDQAPKLRLTVSAWMMLETCCTLCRAALGGGGGGNGSFPPAPPAVPPAAPTRVPSISTALCRYRRGLELLPHPYIHKACSHPSLSNCQCNAFTCGFQGSPKTSPTHD